METNIDNITNINQKEDKNMYKENMKDENQKDFSPNRNINIETNMEIMTIIKNIHFEKEYHNYHCDGKRFKIENNKNKQKINVF